MSRTLGQILSIGAAIAVNVIPGIGQAISGAIVGLGGGTFAAYGVAQAVVSAVTLGTTLAGVSALGSLIAGPGPKPETASTSIKTPRPPRVSAYGASRLYGAYILYETASNGTAVDIYAFHDGEMDSIIQRYLADDKITLSGSYVVAGPDKRYGQNKLSIDLSDGSSPGVPFASAMSLLPGIWTANHRGDGVVLGALYSASVKSNDFLEIYPNGVPVLSIAARWQRCPDFNATDPTDESGWTWTENPIRHLGHYKLKREGIDYQTKIAPTLAYWQAAQNVCDEAVSLRTGGTEPRWRSSVAHKHTDAHKTVCAAIMATCDGWIAPRADGALIVYAGKYYAPTVSIGPADIVAYEWEGVGVDDDTAVNEIICAYISAEHDYNTVETDAWTDEADISARGQVLSTNLDPQVPSHGQVRRLAKRLMQRTNAPNRGSVTTNRGGRAVRGQRYINLRIEEAGATFFDGVAEVTGVIRNVMTGGVTFTWVAADPNIDGWNPATEEGYPASAGERVSQQPLTAPDIDTAIFFGSDEIGEGVPGARIRINGSGPDRDDLTWFARWRTGGGQWIEAPYEDAAAGPPVLIETDFVPVGNVEVGITYQIGDGRIAPWSDTIAVITNSVTFDRDDVTFDSTTITFDRS